MVMLKNIPSILSPEMLYALGRMGHGDELDTKEKSNDQAVMRKSSSVLMFHLWVIILLATFDRFTHQSRIFVSTNRGRSFFTTRQLLHLKKAQLIISLQFLNLNCCKFYATSSVLADANFPSASVAKAGPEIIRADGVTIPQLLDAILQLMPLDTYSAYMAAVMDLVDSDKQRGLKTPVWQVYSDIIEKHEGKKVPLHKIERFEFYDQAKKAFLVIATGETALYGNLILKKGVISPD
ncbi:Fucose mutarotase [Trichoplax sp. H2]|nr:Fucose mutarotase [Trichoplax sp. H2]|eukprot:RDD43518.1 Fucose mutarotase [Trichoplax sp. H2]